MVNTGSRAIIGSWKIMAISVPRTSRRAASSIAVISCPATAHRAPRGVARGRYQGVERGWGHASARPRLARDPDPLPRLQGKADAVDRGHCGIAHHEAHMQILDRDDRLLRYLRLRHALTTVA